MTDNEYKRVIEDLKKSLAWARTSEGKKKIIEDQMKVDEISSMISKSMIPSEELLRSHFNV